MKHQSIEKIDLVVSNLYPFQQVTLDPNCDIDSAIENIDIGGITLIRAAAKNYKYVTVIVDPSDYPTFLFHLTQGTLSESLRFELAKKAFNLVAQYDIAIANYFEADKKQSFPLIYRPYYNKKQDLRYGENPHQKSAFYVDSTPSLHQTISTAKQLQGKELSFNNIADTDSALECVKQFSQPACVIVKHANPCGVAIGQTLVEAYQSAYSADPNSAFGGIIAFNKPLDIAIAQAILDQQFVEVVIAPKADSEALKYFSTKPNVRLLTHESEEYQLSPQSWLDYKRVNGGLLIQESDSIPINISDLKCVTHRTPTDVEKQDLLFAWNIAKFVKSNAIVLAKNLRTIGIGSGQTSRIYSTKIATMKAHDADLDTSGAVMASDAFFPFPDGIDMAAQAGITAIMQPGGSVRDTEVINTANAANIAMLFTETRHFRH